MKKFQRFARLATLAAFLGLSALEAFHCHKAHETAATCTVCQVVHRAPALVTAANGLPQPVLISQRAYVEAAPQDYVQFVAVTHGLSPPVL